MLKLDGDVTRQFYKDDPDNDGKDGLLRNYFMYAYAKWKGTTYQYQAYIDVTYEPPTVPDLMAADLVPDKACYVVNAPITLTYKYRNGGESTDKPFKVVVKVDGVVKKTETIPGGMKNGITLSGTYTGTVSSPIITFTLVVDEDNAVGENEATRGNNVKSVTIRTQTSCGDDGGGGGDGKITGTIEVDKPFIPWGDDNLTIVTVDDLASSCKAATFRISYEDPRGNRHVSPNMPFNGVVNGKLDGSHGFFYDSRNFSYPGGIGSGKIHVFGSVLDNCGNSHTIGTTEFTIGPEPPPEPLELEFKWFYSHDLNNPITRAALGETVALKVTKARDPQGMDVELSWDFTQSTSWVASIPTMKNLRPPYNQRTITGLVTADPAGDQMVCLTGSTKRTSLTVCEYLEVVPPNPIPVITGPSLVKENRPLPEPFRTDKSYSPVAGRTIDHNRDEKGGLWADKYPTPGTYELQLHVYDNTGLKSLRPAKHTLTVFPDMPPIPQLQYQETIVRNQTIQLRNTSYSPDGDGIEVYRIHYGYDSQNNGTCSPTTLLSDHGNNFPFSSDKVGKYCLKVYAKEPGEYGKSAEALYWIDVINDAPEATFTASGQVEEPMPVESHPVYVSDMMRWPITTLDGASPGLYSGYTKTWRNTLISAGIRETDYSGWGYDQLYAAPMNVVAEKKLKIIKNYDGGDPYFDDFIFDDLVLMRSRNSWAYQYYVASSRFEPVPLTDTNSLADIQWNKATDELIVRQYVDFNYGSCSNRTVYYFTKYRLSDLNNGIKKEIEKGQYEEKGRGFNGGFCDSTQGSPMTFADGTNPWHYYFTNQMPEGVFTTLENGRILWQNSRSDWPQSLSLTEYGADRPYFTRHFTEAEISNMCGTNNYGRLTYATTRTFNDKIIMNCSSWLGNQGYSVGLLTLDAQGNLTPFRVVKRGYGILLVPVVYMNAKGDLIKVQYHEVTTSSDQNPEWATRISGHRLYKTEYFDANFNYVGDTLPAGKEDPNLWMYETRPRSEENRLFNGNVVFQAPDKLLTIDPDYSQGAQNEIYVDGRTRTHGQFMSPIQLSSFSLKMSFRYLYEPDAVIPTGLAFRQTNHANMYRLELMKNTAVLFKIVNGRKTELARKAISSLESNTWYTVEVKAIGSNIRIYLNGYLQMDVNDNTFASGGFGPFTEQTAVEFKALSYAVYPDPGLSFVDGYAIVNEPVRYTKTFKDPENDPPIPARSEWTYTHTNWNMFLDYNDGAVGYQPPRKETNEILQFSKVGEYRIDYRIPDDPKPDHRYPDNRFDNYRKYSPVHSKILVVHRKPISLFTLSIAGDNTVVWNDRSYDVDRCRGYRTGCQAGYEANSGIFGAKYYYITPSGQSVNGKLIRPTEQGVYTVAMAVRDEYGAWSDWYTQELNVTNPVAPNKPPAAVLTYPNGSQSSPTQLSTLRPTIRWNQSDPDPGTVFVLYDLIIRDEWGNTVKHRSNVLQNTTATSNSWPLDFDLAAGLKYQVQVRVSDGEAWSPWSNIGWMQTNRPPAAVMTFPNGTQAEPTIVDTLRPTLTWRQTDPDAGTIFSGYQLQITNEANTAMILDTGKLPQWTSSTNGSWTVNQDLPAGQKLRVRVKVWDVRLVLL